MSPTIISSPPNMPSSTMNIAPNPAQVSSSATTASTASPASIPSRRRSSIFTSSTATPLIANTTVNPLASFLSNGPFRLPSAVAGAPTSGTSRRTSSGVGNRRISSSSSDAGSSTDALIDLTGSIGSINRRSNLNLAAGATGAAGSGVSSSGPDGAIGEESGPAPSSARQWNNLSSVVQSISPLLPSSVLFQRAARRVMGSQNIGRLSGNRRGGASSGTLTSSNSVDSSTMERDDLLTLLSAMEEGVSDEPRTGTISSNKNTNNTNTSSLSSVKMAQTPATIATSNTNCGSGTIDSGSETAVPTICGTAGTSGNKVEPLKTLSVSNLNTCVNNEKNVVDDGSAQLTGAIPKTRQDSGCVIVDIGSSDDTATGNDYVDVNSNRSLFGNLFSSLTGTKEEDSVKQTKPPVTNSTTDSTCKSKNNADASQSVAVDIEGGEKLSAANKEDKSKTSGSDDGGNTEALTSNIISGEGRDSNGGEDDGGDATNNNNTNDNNETNGNEEPEENNEEEEETEETTPEDPYWTSVLWQLPVLLGMMLGKYLQYYFFDILAILSVAGLFHIFNIVVKRNVVSNRQITLGWQQCCVKMIQNWKKKLTCRRRQIMAGRWGGVRGAHQNNVINAEGGANGALIGASEPVGEASGPVGGTNTGGGGANNVSDVNTAAATAVATSNSTRNEEKTNPAETAGVQTAGAMSASLTEDAIKADSASSAAEAVTTSTTPSTAATTSVTSTTAGSVMDDWWGRIKHMTIGSTSSEATGTALTPRPSTSATPSTTATGPIRTTTTTSITTPATEGIASTTTTASITNPGTEGAASTTAINTTTTSSEGVTLATASTSNEATVTEVPVPPPLESEASQDSVLSLSEEDQQAQESVECVQERAELVLLTFVAAPLVAFVFYGGLWRGEELWRSLGFLSPAVPPVVLTHVLWLCLAVDYLARLSTVWLKACLCLALLCRSGASVLSKGKYYPLLEMLSQLYRCLLPIHPWFLYLCNYNEYNASADTLGIPRSEEGPLLGGGEVGADGDFATSIMTAFTPSPNVRERSTPSSYQFWGIALFIVYLLNKKVDVATNAVNLWQAFKALRANTGSYGTAPSKSEIEDCGGKCPICHDPFKGPTLLTCSHIFCEGCIVQWFQRERICPMCRAQIADDPLWKDGATSQLPQII